MTATRQSTSGRTRLVLDSVGSSEHIKLISERSYRMLQVLIEDFTLTKEKDGLLLELGVTEAARSIIDKEGKRELFRIVKKSKRKKLQEELDSFHSSPRLRGYRFDASSCPFRYGNGGVLPIVRIESTDYFCLFYRDLRPIGWNIANGASDSLVEMANPETIILREFSEEFLIADHHQKWLYAFELDPEKARFGFQAESLKAWRKRVPRRLLDQYERRPIPLKWISGPDRVCATVRGNPQTSGGYFLNITCEDNAIEVDRIALIHLSGRPVFFDGEQSLNRPVGLFRVDRMRELLTNRSHKPDALFFTSRRRDPRELNGVVQKYLTGIADRRDADMGRDYQSAVDARRQYDLCPITRAMIGRYSAWVDKEGERAVPEEFRTQPEGRVRRCQVFISYRSPDLAVAQWLHRFLEDRGYNAFCSAESLPRLGESDFALAIDAALDAATCLVAIGTRPEYFDSGWVGYEWRSFLNEIRSGRKPQGKVFVFAHDVEVPELPFALRSQQMIPYCPSSPHESFESLYRFIHSAISKMGS